MKAQAEIKKSIPIPDGNGNGKCLKCGKPVEAKEYGYFGDRVTRFYCRPHKVAFYATLKMKSLKAT